MAKLTLWFGLIILAFAVVVAFELEHFKITDTTMIPGQQLTHISLDDVPLSVRIADTPKTQAQGLSGTDSLPDDQGMLFVFPQDGTYQFWMKDMKYALDILWLDDAGHIVYIKENLSPDTYPASFGPTAPARYVLEVNAGFVAAHNVQLGDIVHFH